MKPFKNSVKNAIQFILCLQDSCDKLRKNIEELWLEEYTCYVTEWRENQIESKKENEECCEVKCSESPKSIHPEDSIEEFPELALVDSLLSKARTIRMKDQKLINGLMDHGTLLTSSTSLDSMSKYANSSYKSEKNRVVKRVPQSKSDFDIYQHKSTAISRSKSEISTTVPKHSSKQLNKSSTSLSPKFGIHQNKLKNKSKQSISVISSKDLDKFKKVHVSQPSANRVKAAKVTSESSPNRHQHEISSHLSSHPSSREFFSHIKSRLDAVPAQINIKLWYPFLSPASEELLTKVNCNTYHSTKKVYGILYCIQETMMWIDLLYLIENEICPSLVNADNVNILRIFGDIQSIFLPCSQRIPTARPHLVTK